MKQYIILIFILTGTTFLFAQDDLIVLEEYIITSFIKKGRERSSSLTDNPMRFSIYIIEGRREFYFAKIYPKTEMITYGSMLNLQKNKDTKFMNTIANKLSFDWVHHNTTGATKGSAKVIIEKTTNENPIFFRATVINASNEKSTYKGYMKMNTY